jgi:putative inorganic carbon (HCO3(-)) transporter
MLGYMTFGVALIAVLLPLIITPGVSFSFDITPKIAALILGMCEMLWFCKQNVNRVRAMLRVPLGRWFVGLLAAQWVSLAVAAALSSSRAVSLNGSAWRRFGFLTQTCLILVALLVAAWISEDRSRVRTVLRMCVGAGAVGALYGIFQYFGWDPLLPARAYQAGEGAFMIVRPPGTLGHADYFAAWLVAVFFAGLALAAMEGLPWQRSAAWAASGLAAIAILLGGTRSALLGLAIGVVALVLARPPRMTRRSVALAAAGAACVALFFFSPAGAKLRARVHWSIEDTWGGARLLLWRDSLTMAAQRPWTGFGPETFSREFPAFQSLDLARAYPDFYHESPHNVFLDALTAQGVTGLLTLLALAIFGFRACRRLGWSQSAPLAAGWAGLLVCHQFVVFISPTAAYFYLWLAMLAGSAIAAESTAVKSVHAPAAPRCAWVAYNWPAYALAAVTGLVLAVYAIRLVAADSALATVRRSFEAGDAEKAARAYQTALAWQPKGPGADLYYSRGMAELAARSANPDSRLRAWREALDAGTRAARWAEDRHNAQYSLAALLAAQNDSAGAEQSLRNAIAAAPNWYKPHWTLARLLALTHRDDQALAEAYAAVERGGGRHAEVLDTWNRLKQQRAAKP